MATLTEIKTKTLHYFRDENGLKQGEYKSWHANGQPREHCHYVNDMRHGEFKYWYGNGQLWEHCHYVNGLQQGEYKLWTDDGTLHAHCVYIANKKLNVDLTKLTHKDKFLLNLKYGDFPWLP